MRLHIKLIFQMLRLVWTPFASINLRTGRNRHKNLQRIRKKSIKKH